jgi:hypothetical protein
MSLATCLPLPLPLGPQAHHRAMCVDPVCVHPVCVCVPWQVAHSAVFSAEYYHDAALAGWRDNAALRKQVCEGRCTYAAAVSFLVESCSADCATRPLYYCAQGPCAAA